MGEEVGDGKPALLSWLQQPLTSGGSFNVEMMKSLVKLQAKDGCFEETAPAEGSIHLTQTLLLLLGYKWDVHL